MMKKFTSLTIIILISLSTVIAQVPSAFNYQAVVRNSSGELVADQAVAFRISILQDSETGTVVYSEKHAATTNNFGLANLKIGEGTVESGTFNPAGWGAALHFIKIELDAEGGSAYTHIGTSQLLSVPYAFHAQTVEVDNVDDADADATNELQTISLSGTQLSLSDGGGTVTLPTGTTSPWTSSTAGINYFGGKVGINHDPADDTGALQIWGDGLMSLEAVNNSAAFPTVFAQNNSGTAAYFDGQLVLKNGTQGTGKVLTSDADGKATWETPTTGLWTQNGSEIYFNNNVGIGTSDPLFKLDIVDDATDSYARLKSGAGSAFLFLERSGSTEGSAVVFKTGGANNFYAGVLDSYSYKISTQNPVLNGLQVEIDGDVLVSDEVHHTNTGEANLLPFAYGYVTSAGSLSTGTSNIGTVSKLSTGQYKIMIDDLGSSYVVQVTGVGGSSFYLTKLMGMSTTYFTVSAWDTKSDQYADCNFSFVVYKQ